MTPPSLPAPSLSIVIPTLNAAAHLDRCLAAIRHTDAPFEVVVVDGGSQDTTRDIAAAGGARVIASEPGRGRQLAAGATDTTGAWLLFLHADTVLQPVWVNEVQTFMSDPRHADHAGYFTFALDDDAAWARRLERIVTWRSLVFALPYGDQGLLIRRDHYNRIGGFRSLPIMEDVDLLQRIARGALVALNSKATTSAERYRKDGYVMRPLRNILCQGLWRLGLPITWVAGLYR